MCCIVHKSSAMRRVHSSSLVGRSGGNRGRPHVRPYVHASSGGRKEPEKDAYESARTRTKKRRQSPKRDAENWQRPSRFRRRPPETACVRRFSFSVSRRRQSHRPWPRGAGPRRDEAAASAWLCWLAAERVAPRGPRSLTGQGALGRLVASRLGGGRHGRGLVVRQNP